MRDKKGKLRVRCLKDGCDCDEYVREKELDLCAYCQHTPVVHSNIFASICTVIIFMLSMCSEKIKFTFTLLAIFMFNLMQ